MTGYFVIDLIGRGWVVFKGDPEPPFSTELVSEHDTEEAARAAAEELNHAD